MHVLSWLWIPRKVNLFWMFNKFVAIRKTNLKRGAHIHQPKAWPVPQASTQSYHPGRAAPTCVELEEFVAIPSAVKSFWYMALSIHRPDGYAMLPWLPLPGLYGCAHAWGAGQAMILCMYAPCFKFLLLAGKCWKEKLTYIILCLFLSGSLLLSMLMHINSWNRLQNYSFP